MKLDSNKPTSEDIRHRFTRAGLISLISISLVIFLGQLGISQLMSPFSQSTRKMQAASEQAIRAQTISQLAGRLVEEKRAGRIYAMRADIAAELDQFIEVHRGLASLDSSSGFSGTSSDRVKSVLFNQNNGVDRFAREVAQNVREVFLGDSLFADKASADRIRDKIQYSLNPRINELVGLYASEARRSLRGVQAAQIALLGLVFMLMLIIGRTLYRPIQEDIVSNFLDGANKRDENTLGFDPTTGLPNRAYLRSYVTEVCELGREHDLRSAVINLELMLGASEVEATNPETLNEIMRMAARRVESICRSGDFISRINETSFGIVLPALETNHILNDTIEALKSKLEMPFHLRNLRVKAPVKIGISFADSNSKIPETILNQAAVALTAAKDDEEFDLQFFTGGMARQANLREKEYDELVEAIKSDQLKVYYQPIIHALSGQFVGFEALVRWAHPTQGILTPVHFIETAENRNLIDDVARFVFGKALTDLTDWHENQLDVPLVAVNLSPSQLEADKFMEELKWITDSYGQHPSRLALEVSAKSFDVIELSKLSKRLDTLSQYGFRIFLDDFGTGQLELSRLKNIHFDQIKIDRAFISNINSNAGQQAIASKMIKSAKDRNLSVIAEGVETPSERLTLQRLGIDSIQGFLISEPMSGEAATRWLEGNSDELNIEARAG